MVIRLDLLPTDLCLKANS